ncbi:DpnD/PcfM family protein [Turicibacter sanguinis]|uniref:DpnD/PcfM family protein n=1 Tax=Turicibacter sanguinis TaxID=154288 RepID=UPI0021D4DD5E|nr:DpnD/PcfM family protein [Turicibacter sanguinis]MCU7201206.1 DpnD/PcfM family protein [Turicibacter sanguinis]
MSYKLTICITETLERLIEVDVDHIDCDPIEYVRQQYLDEEIILDANDAWLSLFLLILIVIVLMVEDTATMDTSSS